MAIQIVGVSKLSEKVFAVTVQDTAQEVGMDENGAPLYRKYTENYNTNLQPEELKRRFEERIVEEAGQAKDLDDIKASVKASVESIDTAKLLSREG